VRDVDEVNLLGEKELRRAQRLY